MLLHLALLVPLSFAHGRPDAGAQAGGINERVQLLALPAQTGAPFDVAVTIDGVSRAIRLEPWSLRAPAFQVLVQGPTGALENRPAPPPRTYRGEVSGAAGSVVTASLGSDGLRATVRGLADDQTWEVVPTGRRSGACVEHVVQRALASPDPVLPCGVALDSRSGDGHRGASFVSGDSGSMICEIAIDCDYEQYVALGSSETATIAAVESLMNATGEPFESDLGITFAITAIVVRTSQASDPYQSYAGTIGSLLTMVTDHWEANHQAIPRDMVHLFSVKPWSDALGGVAAVSKVCTCTAYSLSKSLGDDLIYLPSPGLLAHELGHVLGGSHCDGNPECWIMCPGLYHACNPPGQFHFGEYSTNEILNGSSNLACLTTTLPTVPPSLTGVSPSVIPILSPTPVTVTGSGLADAKGLRIVAPWGQLHSDLCAAQIQDDATILFTPPVPLALGSVQLAALSGPGSSNGVTFEYVATDPPQLIVLPMLCIPTASTKVLSWKAASQPGLWAVLLTSYNNPATTTVGGFTVLANGSSAVIGTLNSVGFGTYARALPASLAPGVLYSQLTVYDSVSALVGVSGVQATQLAIAGSPGCDVVSEP